MDLMVTDGSSSQISDSIKDILFQKSAANIEAIRPHVALSLFGDESEYDEQDIEDDEE